MWHIRLRKGQRDGSLPLCPGRGPPGFPWTQGQAAQLLTQAALASSAFLPAPLNGVIEALCTGTGH